MLWTITKKHTTSVFILMALDEPRCSNLSYRWKEIKKKEGERGESMYPNGSGIVDCI